MSERLLELQAILAEVRRRWTQRAAAARLDARRGGCRHGSARRASAPLLLVAREGIAPRLRRLRSSPLAALFAIGARALAAASPSHRLDNSRASSKNAIRRSGRRRSSPPSTTRRVPMRRAHMRELLAADAVRAVRGARARRSRVARTSIRQVAAARGRGDGRARRGRGDLCAVSSIAPRTSRPPICSRRASPSRSRPGSTKVRAGQPVTITARVHGLNGGVVPTLTR